MLECGPYLNNRLDCRRESEQVSVGGQARPDLQGRAALVPTRDSYLLPVRHPVSDCGNQDGAQQDLGGVVDQERD